MIIGMLVAVIGLLIFLYRYLFDYGDTRRIMNGKKDHWWKNQKDDLTS